MTTLVVKICFFYLYLWNRNVHANTTDSCDLNQQPLSKVILSISSRLMKEIDGEDNIFFSPLSISAALAMLYIGTSGSTRAQMSNALQYHTFAEECLSKKLTEDFKNLSHTLESDTDMISLLTANGVFVHHDLTVAEEYTSKLQEYFNTNVTYLDFTHEGQQSLTTINEWISQHTQGMLPKVLTEPLDPVTVLVLLNVIYFKGLWEHPFSENKSFNGFFFGKGNSRKIVTFMELETTLNYYYDLESKNHFLEMNYSSGNISMLLVIPKSLRDCPLFELTSENLCAIKRQLQPEDVKLIFPKFRLEYKRELSKDMMNLGLNELFSDRADLSRIRKQNDLHVSLMIHKAILEVDERGSKASAASGIGIDVRRKPSDPLTLWVNHCFKFYIIHKELNIILFTGRLSDP